jgi:hypothetical protein
VLKVYCAASEGDSILLHLPGARMNMRGTPQMTKVTTVVAGWAAAEGTRMLRKIGSKGVRSLGSGRVVVEQAIGQLTKEYYFVSV